MKGPVMDDTKLVKYKTVMCHRMVRANNCRYGHLCDFAHDPQELRRNLNQHWYHGTMCDKVDHDDKKCDYAHNELEIIYHPAVYKTKLCDKFSSPNGCPKNQYCAMAHGKHELRTLKAFPDREVTYGNRVEKSPKAPARDTSKKHESFADAGRVQGAPQQQQQQGQMAVHAPGSIPHRQQSFNTQVPYSDQVGGIPPVQPMSPVPMGHEFQETTNDLKIRILDLVDQISTMHFERAMQESHHSNSQATKAEVQRLNQLLQESYNRAQEHSHLLSRSEEKASRLQTQLTSTTGQLLAARDLIKIYRGESQALARLSPPSLLQVSRQVQQASTAVASFKPVDGKTDLSQLEATVFHDHH